jgi:crotonobetainyl-CoA:carnitine CoA-transferase CaiB-like acyl-CoA transferase
VVEAPDAEAGSVLMHTVIPRLSATPGRLRLPAPAVGEHTRELLGAIGCDAERIAGLARRGVVGLAGPC